MESGEAEVITDCVKPPLVDGEVTCPKITKASCNLHKLFRGALASVLKEYRCFFLISRQKTPSNGKHFGMNKDINVCIVSVI